MALGCESVTLPCMANYKRVPIEDRFWAKVEITGFCWNWTASTVRGYGAIGEGGKRGKKVYAHRWAYENLVGPIPDGLTLDHLCRNTLCVNPDHVEPVSGSENVKRHYRAVNIGNTCHKGHPLDYARPDGTGRQCSTCNAERARERYANSDEAKKKVADYAVANRDRINAARRARRAAKRAEVCS
jgi:hypothetical protein